MTDKEQLNGYNFYTTITVIVPVMARSVEEAVALLAEQLKSGRVDLGEQLTVDRFAMGLGVFPPQTFYATAKPIGAPVHPYTYIMASSLKKAAACAKKYQVPDDRWELLRDEDSIHTVAIPVSAQIWVYGDAATLDWYEAVVADARASGMIVEHKS